MALGENLKRLREKNGLTTEKLGEAVGVTQSMITKYEIGIRVPNVIIALEIAKRLGVTCEELVNGKEA